MKTSHQRIYCGGWKTKQLQLTTSKSKYRGDVKKLSLATYCC